MALLNYSTTVAAEKTAHEIVRLLGQKGARQVLTDYDEGRPTAIAFALQTASSGMRQYRLPVDIASVEKVLRADLSVPARYKSAAQAERVAWRILKDWVEAQLAIIATQMVSADEVFLPYMLLGGGTVYELWRDERLALGSGER